MPRLWPSPLPIWTPSSPRPLVAVAGAPVEQGEGDSFVAAFARAWTRCRVPSIYGLPRPPRSGCESDCTPVKFSYVTPATTSVRSSTAVPGSATWATVARRCCRRPPKSSSPTVCPRVRGSSTSVATDCVTLPAEQVFGLAHPDLINEYPALRSLDAYPHNLPVQLTSFVGRRAELKEVSNLLAEARLVTLTGSGGAGKTRLAIQVGAEMLGEFPDGVWLVELAPVSDPDQVSPTVAHTLGMPEQAAGTPTDALARYLDAKRALLVFDNCEQVVDACAALAEALLRACEKIVVLATSREPLGIVGELAWQVPSLSLPEVGEPAPIGGVGVSEAVSCSLTRRAGSTGFCGDRW